MSHLNDLKAVLIKARIPYYSFSVPEGISLIDPEITHIPSNQNVDELNTKTKTEISLGTTGMLFDKNGYYIGSINYEYESFRDKHDFVPITTRKEFLYQCYEAGLISLNIFERTLNTYEYVDEYDPPLQALASSYCTDGIFHLVWTQGTSKLTVSFDEEDNYWHFEKTKPTKNKVTRLLDMSEIVSHGTPMWINEAKLHLHKLKK